MFELRGVTAGYGSTTVLRDVSIVVPPTSIVALLGANGAGKTTLLRVASGLIRPRAGSVALDGVALTGQDPHRYAKAGVCHIPEGRGIFRSLTVRDNIVLQAGTGALDDAIERATGAFPILGTRLNQIAGTMSGGEQQMLALARAYVSCPRVVLLDEVSMGLAPRVVDDIFEFLRRLASEGTALLIVEQYVTKALQLAELVFLLSKGSVVFAGEPNELDSRDVFRSYLGAGDTDRDVLERSTSGASTSGGLR
jgi:branched-chain amino acid transport system ATP-binding protein